MKKTAITVALILCLVLSVFALASCGGDEGDETIAATTENDGPYTVTFVAGERETTVTVERGETPVCPEEFLSWETDEHYCKVTGWDKEIVPAQSDATYTATVGEYGLTVYDVLFVLPYGIVSVPTHEGETPTPPKGYETDNTQQYKIGAFKQWNKELTAPTAENTENGSKKMSYVPIYTYEPRYVASLLSVKDGAKGILTMSYDDGLLGTAKWVNEKNKIYGTNGSCMMVPNFHGTEPNYKGNLNEWIALFADGTLEPECHSMTHDLVLPSERWGSYEGSKYNNIRENYDVELVQSKAYIEKSFPGHTVLCFAPSNNTLSTYSFKSDGNGNLVKDASGNPIVVEDGGAQAVANATYFAIRQGQRGFQSLDPTFDANPGGWYNLYMQSFRSTTDQNEKLRLGKGYLDETIQKGAWLIIMCHGITASGDGGDIKQSYADQFLAYASNYIQSGELWAATFGEATRYIRERQNTTVSARFENNAVLVDMKIIRRTEEGKYLGETIFNYPLTVEVRVPDTWKNVRYEDKGEVKTAAVYKHDGASFAMVNLTPGADGATVTTEVRRAAAN
ncbi:MAG: hypothetical protein IKP74_04405 [Clostridia bacterium]|nr:hypothetical protein [Clostridia bacterium]